MSKELSIKIDNKLFNKLKNHGIKDENVINKALHQFFEDKKQNDETDNKIVTTLKKNIQTLKKEKKNLEIEKVCLMNENKNLQTRIDDLVHIYPSAVALLGKASESKMIGKNRWFFRK